EAHGCRVGRAADDGVDDQVVVHGGVVGDAPGRAGAGEVQFAVDRRGGRRPRCFEDAGQVERPGASLDGAAAHHQAEEGFVVAGQVEHAGAVDGDDLAVQHLFVAAQDDACRPGGTDIVAHDQGRGVEDVAEGGDAVGLVEAEDAGQHRGRAVV